MEVSRSSKSDVLSTAAKIKCGFCAPPQHDSSDALRRSRSLGTRSRSTRLAGPFHSRGDAYDRSAS